MPTTLRISYVDYSAVDRTSLAFIVALRDLHKAIDPHCRLRRMLGHSLTPARVTVHPLGGGLIALLARDVQDMEAAHAES